MKTLEYTYKVKADKRIIKQIAFLQRYLFYTKDLLPFEPSYKFIDRGDFIRHGGFSISENQEVYNQLKSMSSLCDDEDIVGPNEFVILPTDELLKLGLDSFNEQIGVYETSLQS